MKYLFILLIAGLLVASERAVKFSGAKTVTFDTIVTGNSDFTPNVGVNNYLQIELTGAASYVNYNVQTSIDGNYYTILTDSLGVTADGGQETILLRNIDSLYRFPYDNLRLNYTTNDPTGTVTMKANIITIQ